MEERKLQIGKVQVILRHSSPVLKAVVIVLIVFSMAAMGSAVTECITPSSAAEIMVTAVRTMAMLGSVDSNFFIMLSPQILSVCRIG